MSFPLWFSILAFITPAAQILICITILRRRELRKMPVFFSLCLVDALTSIALYAVHGHYAWYYWLFWYSRIALSILQIALLGELVAAIPAIKASVSAQAREVGVAAALMIAAGSWFMSYHDGATFGGRIHHVVTLLNRSATIASVTFAIAIMLGISLMGIGWSVRWSRIGAGYIVGLMVQAGAAYAFASHNKAIRVAANYSDSVIAAAVAIYWAYTMLRPESTTALSQDQIAQIRQHLDSILPRLQTGKGHRDA